MAITMATMGLPIRRRQRMTVSAAFANTPDTWCAAKGVPARTAQTAFGPESRGRWLDAFEEWHCPSCAPRHFYVPLNDSKTGERWPGNREPLLKDLGEYLKKHPFLVRDFEPKFHKSRKGMAV